jgi:hypothetical protein
MVFAETKDLNKKVAIFNYLAPKVPMVRRWFKEDYPDRKLFKVVSLGVKEYEIEAEKYYALYKDTETV